MRLPRPTTAWGSRKKVLPEAELSCTSPCSWLAAPAFTASTGRPWRWLITVSCNCGPQRRIKSWSRLWRSWRWPSSWRRRPSRIGLARSATLPPSSRAKRSCCSNSGRVRRPSSRAVVTGRSWGSSIWRRSRRAAARVSASCSRASPPAQPPLAQSCRVACRSTTPAKLRPPSVRPSRASNSTVSCNRRRASPSWGAKGKAWQSRCPSPLAAKPASCWPRRSHSSSCRASA